MIFARAQMSHICLSDLVNFLMCLSSIFKPLTNFDLLLASINNLRFPCPVLLCIKVSKSTVVDDPRYECMHALVNIIEQNSNQCVDWSSRINYNDKTSQENDSILLNRFPISTTTVSFKLISKFITILKLKSVHGKWYCLHARAVVVEIGNRFNNMLSFSRKV